MPKQPIISERARRVNPSPTLSITAKIKALKAQGQDLIGFTAGEPDFDTADHIKQAAIDALKEGFTKYTPTGGIDSLKAAICAKLKRDNGLAYENKNVLVSVGGKHSLFNAFLALLDPGDEVIIPAPYWVTYPEQVVFAEGKPVFVQTTEAEGFKLTADQVAKAITPKTKALVLNSPSNPTGAVYAAEEIEKIAKLAVANDFWVISDEMYERLTYGEEAVSIASFGPDIWARTLTMNGCSKAYSMTGWRIGYTAGPAEVIAAMTRIQDQSTSNPTSIAQRAAVAALTGPQDVVETMRLAFMERRDVLVNGLNALPGVRCPRPGGAFYVFPDFSAWYKGGIKGSDDLAAVLLDKYGLGVIPGSGFGADNCIRLSYATSMAAIEGGLERFKKAARDLAG
ncbi:MAG TPA: pyridoxal phosphate-dependent aminotransferase [Armatimonadota bacterium]|jgi:aspartate aminotransferase